MSTDLTLQELNELEMNIRKQLKKVKKAQLGARSLQRFLLILTREQAEYLEWASTTRGVFKAQIVRDLLDTAIRKDKKYISSK